MATPQFERSVDLKRLFNRELEKWSKKNRAGLEELARLCGVSPAYLAHVKRYGRIPGKPILLLLALHFELEHPEQLFHAAGIHEPFPFPQGVRIEELRREQNELFNFSINTTALAETIRHTIQREMSAVRGSDHAKGRPIKVGLNVEQRALFNSHDEPNGGLFHDFLDMLATHVRCQFETVPIKRSEYRAHIEAGDIDIFGPILPDLPPRGVIFTAPLLHVGRSALFRKRPAKDLAELPAPESVEDIINNPYSIAVVRDSREHLFANITLQKDDSALILCDSIDEGIERITLSSIAKTAHVFLCNSLTALAYHEEDPEQVGIAFAEHDTVLATSDVRLAVRPDWEDLVYSLNNAITYLAKSGALMRRTQHYLSDEMREVVEVALPSTTSSATTTGGDSAALIAGLR